METQQQVVVIPKTLNCGKELSEVGDMLCEVIKDIRAGKKFEALSENFQNIVTAIQGWEMMDDEIKHESRSHTLGYVVAKVAEGFDTPVVKVPQA